MNNIEEEMYGFYNSQPNNDLTSSLPEKVDGRKLPIAYPQMGGERGLSTGCKFDGDHSQCKWGCKSTYNKHCVYFRFGIICDKLIGKDEEEIN